MKLPGRRRQSERRQRGSGLVELMVASLLLCIGMMALVNVWVFSLTVTTNTDDKAIGYSLARQAMERVKMQGFTTAAEGSTTLYYDSNQVLKQSATGARFAVTTSVTSDLVSSGTIGQAGAVPAQTALRQVVVTVTLSSGGTQVVRFSTYLVKAGI